MYHLPEQISIFPTYKNSCQNSLVKVFYLHNYVMNYWPNQTNRNVYTKYQSCQETTHDCWQKVEYKEVLLIFDLCLWTIFTECFV